MHLDSQKHTSVPAYEGSRAAQLFGLMKDVQGFLLEGVNNHGPLFTIHPIGLCPYTIVADSDVVADLHGAPEGVLTDYPANAFVEPLFGRNSVIFQDGETLVRLRSAMMRLFREIELDTYLEVLRDEIRSEFHGLEGNDDDEVEIELGEFFRGCFRRANVRIVFGINGWQDFERETDELLDALSSVGSLFGRQWAYRAGLSNPRRCRRQIDRLIMDRWEEVRKMRGQESHSSAIALLSGMEKEHGRFEPEGVTDLLFSMFLTGYVPPGATAAWSTGRVLEDDALKEKVFAELEVSSGRTPIVDSLFFEVLRWHNPLPFTSRTVAKKCRAGGVDWPVGTRFMIASFLVHRCDPMWEDAEAFRAERFIEIPTSLSCKGFIPFGGGAHRCLGMHMAPLLNRLCLGTFLSLTGREVRFHGDVNQPSRFYAGTAIPGGAIRVTVPASRLKRSSELEVTL